MKKEFLAYIKQEKLFTNKDNILVAASGGPDSTVLCELLHQCKFSFALAHCNFKLRGKESDADADFVELLAERYRVPFHSIEFPTEKIAKKQKTSIQVTARDLRYNWFEELRQQHDYSVLATAHHMDDSVETFFINLIRGTGISGLHGILPKTQKAVRPILFASKEAILEFAKKHALNFRSDESNTSEKYLRNKIRLQLLPLLQSMNPSISETVEKEIASIRQVEQILSQQLNKVQKQVFTSSDSGHCIDIRKLSKLAPLSYYLYQLLKPFGFNSTQCSSIEKAMNGIPGKQWKSSSHLLTKDRGQLIITKLSFGNSAAAATLKQSQSKLAFANKTFRCSIIPVGKKKITLNTANNCANLDLAKLKFPLTIRRWKPGDVFFPFGMKGRKKLSDFLTDLKLPKNQKDEVLVLCSGDKIAWVVGHRIDDRFKLEKKSDKIYFVSVEIDVIL